MGNTYTSISVPTSAGSGAGTAVSTFKAENRTIEYNGAAGDVVDVEGSSNGSTGWTTVYTFLGPEGRATVNDRGLYYRATRREGSGSATLTVTGEIMPALSALTTITQTVTHADLTAAATSQVINLGSALPAKAMPLAVGLELTTPFTGGGATAAVLKIGTSGDNDAIVASANLFAAAVDGQTSDRPDGIAPNKCFVTEGAVLQATFSSDVNVVALTAGSVTVRIVCAILD